MKRTQSIVQSVFFIVCTTLAFAGFAQAQSVQQTQVSTSCATDPQCVTGNGENSATRLNHHDRVVIKAREVGQTTLAQRQCRAVLNNGAKDLFVPWNTPGEWTAFLNAAASGNLAGVSLASCCAPQNATVCGSPVYYADGVTPIPLGYRSLGKQTDDATSTLNWGAETDILGPLSAPAPLNYQVTYVCEAGNWVKTREVGSCTPTNGYCSSLDGQYVHPFPSNPNDYTETLCAQGSTFDTTIGLITTSTGWSWTCDGTQGMPTASCTAYNNPPINGSCGSINNPGSSGPSYTIDQLNSLELNAPSSICSTGTFSGAFTDNGGTSLHWSWQCLGQYGGNNSGTCKALNAAVNGSCGSDNGQIYTAMTGPPASGLCRSNETAIGLAFNAVTNLWTWTCSGIGGGSPSGTCSSTYNATYVNGSCGSDNGQTFPNPNNPLLPTDPNLCSQGTASNFVGVFEDGGMYWTWTCNGASGGSTSWCAAFSLSQNGVCGSDNGSVLPGLTSTDPNLCSVGGVDNTFSTGNSPEYYTWMCDGPGWGSNVPCGAYNENPLLAAATCGPANGSSSLGAPATGTLCSQGNPSGVSTSSDGTQWLWSCTSLDGTNTASCSATVTPPFANGACGATNNTAIPNTPNYNLCATGTAGTLSGTGPWTWTCLGTSGGTNSPECQAFLCNACTGTTTVSKTAGHSGTSGSCNITGTASWTETDALIPGAANTETISWLDVVGSFSNSVAPGAAAWPTYCPPCYTQVQSVSGAALTINGLSGTCPGLSVNQVIPATNVSVSP